MCRQEVYEQAGTFVLCRVITIMLRLAWVSMTRM